MVDGRGRGDRNAWVNGHRGQGAVVASAMPGGVQAVVTSNAWVTGNARWTAGRGDRQAGDNAVVTAMPW